MAMVKTTNPYLKTQVETASKEQLVVMLFDGIVRFSENARNCIENNQIEDCHHNIMRAQAIVMELIYTVDKDKGGEIAKNLLALHAYAFTCLVNANMHKDVTKIDEVQHIYRELREGWVGAMKSLGLISEAAAPTPTKPAAPNPGKPAIPAAPKPTNPAGYVPGKSLLPPKPQAALQSLVAAKAPAAPVKPQLSIPVVPQNGTYGMGKTAIPNPNAAAPAAPAAPINAQKAAMLSAYNKGRSIA